MISFNTKEISTNELFNYYKPEEINGFCERCPKYGQYWSCPPHSFDPIELLSEFKYASVVAIKIHLDHLDSKTERLEYYNQQKRLLNEQILNSEKMFSESMALISGNCWICEECTRMKGEACILPEKQRYSLESLGFKLSDILQELFNEKLQWTKGKTPDSLFTIKSMLSKKPIDQKRLIEQLSSVKES